MWVTADQHNPKQDAASCIALQAEVAGHGLGEGHIGRPHVPGGIIKAGSQNEESLFPKTRISRFPLQSGYNAQLMQLLATQLTIISPVPLQSKEYAQLQLLLSTIAELKDDDESIKEMRAILMVGAHRSLIRAPPTSWTLLSSIINSLSP